MRARWVNLALAQRRGEALPPIEVYRVGGCHFVEDGHHRVSIARATGQKFIDAYVTEVLTAVPAPETSRRVGWGSWPDHQSPVGTPRLESRCQSGSSAVSGSR